MAVKLVGVTFILLIIFADVTFWIFGTSLLLAIEVSLTNSRRCSIDASGWTASVTASVRALTGPDVDSVRLGNLPDGASVVGSGSRELAGGRLGRGPPGRSGGDAAERGGRHLYLAKRKIKWAMIFCAQFSLQGYALLICSIFTKYGTAAPSVMFGLQMTILPLIWHVVQIQLHAGRSKARLAGGVGLHTGRTKGGYGNSIAITQQQEKWRRKSSGNISMKFLSTHGVAFGGQPHSVAPVERDEETAAVAAAETDAGMDANAMAPC